MLGFVTTLPGIWRALQCIRRYWDTGNKFPHLLNCGKYFATIMFYSSLSIYRLDQKPSTKAVFIMFATINSIYTSFWDIYYDWSLGDPHAKHRFLRKELAYKKIWWYYAAMVVDPILRFNWVLYTVIPLQLQHSAVTSFGVSILEVCRRGFWSLFRVENEHCTNVGRFRASRDVPLPYHVPASLELTSHTGDQRGKRVDVEQPDLDRPATPTVSSGPPPGPRQAATTTGTDLERSTSSARQRRALQNDFKPSPLQRAFTHVGDIFRKAHAEDFERKQKPELGQDPRENKVDDDDSDDDSEGEEEAGDSGDDTPARRRESVGSDEEFDDDEEQSALSRIREDFEVGMSGARGDRTTAE